jgi:hypothetical protein
VNENNTTDGQVNIEQQSLEGMADQFIQDYKNADGAINLESHNMFSQINDSAYINSDLKG